jgi:biopolymer transport protein ExbD
MKLNVPITRRPRIEILALIDIVFLLLVFFIYAMLSMAVHKGLPVLLPTSSSAMVDKQLILSVTVKSDGTIYVDQKPVALDTLTDTLQSMSKGRDSKSVLLFADRDLPYQNLFHVLDRIKDAGLEKISLQAKAEDPS